MPRKLMLWLPFFFFNNLVAQEGSPAMPSLAVFEMSDEYHGHIRVYYCADLARVVNTKVASKYFEIMGYNVRMIETKLAPTDSVSYTIDFTSGASDDPMFIIFRNTPTGLIELRSIGGTEISLPGDGAFYVSGHTNNMFDMHRKFTAMNGEITEVKQPFYYVGMKSFAKEEVIIYTDTTQVDMVAVIPVGTEIEVILNVGSNYLIKAPFDLTGWMKVALAQETPLQGIYYKGD